MRVHIGTIRNERGATREVTFKESLPSPWNRGDSSTIPVEVSARVTNSGRSYQVDGTIKAVLEVDCDRCLESFQFPIEVDFHEEFRPHHRKADSRVETTASLSDEDGQDDETDVDYGDDDTTFEGDTFFLNDVVRDYLLLELPAKVTCRDDCRGICPQCGQNQNESTCLCDQETVDPRLAGLADFFKDQG